MAMVTDATDLDFDQKVIQRSSTVPVVVDFWAPWCGPCRFLGPVLEGLADEASGRWELVKVNVDESPRLSIDYSIQGIPAVKAFRDGMEVAQFVGAQPRPEVEAWLATFLPDPADDLIAAGLAAEGQGDFGAARTSFERALSVNPASRQAEIGLRRVELLENASRADEETLKGRLEADPDDVEAAAAMARLRSARNHPDVFEPLVNLISVSENPSARKAAQAAFLDLAGILPPDDPRVAQARRRLASVLYR